jgi:uncharacterized protein
VREAVEKLIKALVDDEEAVRVEESDERGSIVFRVRVAETDMGKLIGREGKTIRALRSLVHAASRKRGHRFVLEVVE